MGKTWILKSNDSKPVGYIQQSRGMVVSRMNAVGKEACELYMFFRDEHYEKVCMENSGEELSCEAEGELTGAVICRKGSALAHSGAAALRVFESLRIREEKSADPQPESQKKGRDHSADSQAATYEFRTCDHPARRWPPHPCCPAAHYAGGKWYQDGDEII